MARIQADGVEALLKTLEKGRARMIAHGGKAVEAGAAVLVEAMKQTAPVRTGGLRESIKAGKSNSTAQTDSGAKSTRKGRTHAARATKRSALYWNTDEAICSRIHS